MTVSGGNVGSFSKQNQIDPTQAPPKLGCSLDTTSCGHLLISPGRPNPAQSRPRHSCSRRDASPPNNAAFLLMELVDLTVRFWPALSSSPRCPYRFSYVTLGTLRISLSCPYKSVADPVQNAPESHPKLCPAPSRPQTVLPWNRTLRVTGHGGSGEAFFPSVRVYVLLSPNTKQGHSSCTI